jgi:N-acetyl sugar amidotransferase
MTYQICTQCVMDTSDPDITFDSHGVCNHCRYREDVVRRRVLTGAAAERHVAQLVEQMKRDSAGKQYDCVIGVSGGVDSSFVAYKVKQLGLRPLAVHLDNGWDSELAVKNIENLLKILDIDLYTEVLDWEEFKDLQLAFLKASTPDSEVPTDHAIFAVLKQVMRRQGVKYLISGSNARTETHLPLAWSQGHFDWRYIKAIHARFGTVPLKTFPHLGYFEAQRLLKSDIAILNYLDYVKEDAKAILERELGWKYYGGKHYESIYTRFYQGYVLPKKFGYDKRRAHLSSLICSGQTTREAALLELQQEPYPVDLQASDKEYVSKKFGLTEAEFDAIVMNAPPKSFWDYPSYTSYTRTKPYAIARRIYRFVRRRGQAAPAAQPAVAAETRSRES